MTTYLEEQFNFSDKSFVSALDELPLWSGYFGSVILDRVKFVKGINILDVGCGTGFPLLEIAQRFGNTSTAYGVDPWCEALERAEQKMKAMNINNVKVLNKKAEELPFEDNFFGLIVSNNGVNNVEDPVSVFKECYRVCRPGGQFLFTVNLPGTMIEFYTIFEEILKENALIDKIDEMRQHIYKKRKPLEVNVSMAEQAGFSIDDIFTGQFRFRYADGTAMLNHSFIKLAFMDSWKNIVPLQHRNDIFDRVERKLNKFAAEKGECTLTIPFACFDCRKK